MQNFAHDLFLTKNHINNKKYTNKSIRRETRNILPKKNWGQNFLSDTTIIEQIFHAIPSNIGESILQKKIRLIEIGIGLGDLTKRLALKYPLLCYEIDTRLIALAKQNLANELTAQQVVILEADALHIRSGNGYLFESEYFLVSNLPYYIATSIILQTLRDSLCTGFLVMTQKEVAQKFCAKVHNKEYCALSVISEILGEIHYLFDVLPQSFIPQPKVDSAVFCFERTRDLLPVHLESILKYAFLSPRKKLFSNLTKWDWLGRVGTQEIFDAFNLPETIRAHEVSSEQYCKIADFTLTLNKG
ncbi:ribosomal RNA small subunit methyltransferase A [Helicobacter aurati]|uniref:Ribosomal RNA small subunit methyltransferase A n=1 Tax=Helicobacter aurati TaxID=137778 RepID=A0A3D8J2G9_9HELI|nr:16S rRNA (adenine(1518)-N(6)/adenine(1519)-N(6))-dimethyltransferase RsmA [Helicobacter aurati]RDU71054.1 ribosomal RNA small subunit methyltransferase A [Helicobacter aurati]